MPELGGQISHALGPVLFLVKREMGEGWNRTTTVVAVDREDAKRQTRAVLGGNEDYYVVSPLTGRHDEIATVHASHAASAGSQEPAPVNPVGLACPECGAFVPEPAPKFGSVDGAPAERDDRIDSDTFATIEEERDHWRNCAVNERNLVMGDAYTFVKSRISNELDLQAGAAQALAAATAMCTASEARARGAEVELARVQDQLDKAREERDETFTLAESLKRDLARAVVGLRTILEHGPNEAHVNEIARAVLAASGVTEKGNDDA